MTKLLFVLGCVALLQAAKPEPPAMFRSYGPIEEADPTTRRDTVLFVPTRLMIDTLSSPTRAVADTSAMRPVRLTVGHEMVLGLRKEFHVVEKDEWHWMATGFTGAVSFPNAGVFLHPQQWPEHWDVVRSTDMMIVGIVTIFETDIPSQHFWQPESGRYAELWSDTLRAAWRHGM